jgi:anti-sigma factor RsiW
VSDHLSQPIIEGYRQRTLPTPDLLLVDDHIAACETCRLALHQLEQAEEIEESLLASLGTEAQQPLRHLAFEELDAYVSERLDDVEREIIANHLHICAQCHDEAQDLRSFKSSLEAQIPSPAGKPIASASASPNLVERLKAWLRVLFYQPAFQIAVALVIVATAIFFLILPARREAADLRARLTRLEQENLELQKQSATLADLQMQLETLRQENEALQIAQPITELPASALALKDAGGTVTIDADGTLQGFASLSSANQQLIKNALQSGRIMMPATISEVATKAGVLMSSASPGVSFALQSPVGTFVQSSRPVFRWRGLTGATSYVVTVYDAGFRVVVKSDDLTKTEWIPASELERGITYRWQVTANVNGKQMKSPVPPAPEARFKVIESAKADEVQRLRQILANSHLATGVLYAQAGLLDDAERELQELLRANPQSAVVKRLLQSVRTHRR